MLEANKTLLPTITFSIHHHSQSMYKIVKANLLILRPDLHVKSLYQLIIIGSQQDTSISFFPVVRASADS